MKNVARLVPLLAALACGDKVAATSPTTTVTPTTTTITFPGATLEAEVAASTALRDQGLMGRTSLGANRGMLFVYAVDQSPQLVAFWMKDTPIDLSIAFLDAGQRVINVDEMTKNTLNSHAATANFRYAIEANAGWFTAHGIAAGATASFSLPAGTVISP